MKRLIALLLFSTSYVLADQCQITSPLPMPVTINGCTFGPGALPGGSTSYIQNTLSPTTSTQAYSVQTGTVTGSLTVLGLTAGQCTTTDSTGKIISTSCGSSGGGLGNLGVSSGSATNSIVVSSPTSNIVVDSNTFVLSLQGTTSSFITLNSSSVTLQGLVSAGTLGVLTTSSATATYLQNSSATLTYLNVNQGLTQSSATATYLQSSSATATYLQQSSATATYLQQSSATATYLNVSSATATYLQLTSATITYGNLASTQTWSGQETWASPQQSTFTFGVTAGSYTVKTGQGNNTGVIFQNGQTYTNSSSFLWNGTTLAVTAMSITQGNGLHSSFGINGATLTIQSPANATYEAYFSTTATNYHVSISTSGHFLTNGSILPVISACGSTPNGSVSGDDNAGIITVGGTAPTACTLTFANTWGSTPVCTVTDNSLTIAADISTLNPTTLTLGFGVGGLAGGLVYYRCSCSGGSCR